MYSHVTFSYYKVSTDYGLIDLDFSIMEVGKYSQSRINLIIPVYDFV